MSVAVEPKSYLHMAEQIKERLGLADSVDDVFELLTPNGELFTLGAAFFHLFASELMPTDVANPKPGAGRFKDGRLEEWDGRAWLGRAFAGAYQAEGAAAVRFLKRRRDAAKEGS